MTSVPSMAFWEMRTWFDELGPEERAPLEELHRRSVVSARVIPVDHGPDIGTQIEAGKAHFLASKDPFCLVRIGDCEIGFLGAGLVTPPADLPFQFGHTGFARDAFYLRRDYFSAIQEVALVGLQENWAVVRTHTATLLRMMGLPLPLPNGIEVHVPYKLLVDGTLFQYLVGKKTLLIGSAAPRLRDCLNIKQFLDRYSFFGPLDKVNVVGAIQTPDRSAWTAYDWILQEVEKIDFDVALLSCGGIAKPLAWRLWKKGKTALDVGFVFDALMGNPERQFRPVLSAVQWPAFP